MKREQKKALRKQARFERSRAERSWDSKEVVARVFPQRPMVAPPVDVRERDTIGTPGVANLIGQYMRALGVPLPMLDMTAKPIKDAEVIDVTAIIPNNKCDPIKLGMLEDNAPIDDEKDALLPYVANHPDCPPAYGGCTCSCHHMPGVKHCFPCCRPLSPKVIKRCKECNEAGAAHCAHPEECGNMTKHCTNCNDDRWLECDGSHGMPPGVGYACGDCNPDGKLKYKEPLP